jgi:GTP-binding protein
LNIDATFVTSATTAEGFPRDGAPEITMVGRSNVGKSSLINALVRQRLARTSAAPGKTRLANVYRVVRGGAPPFYLVALPGYGYARGDADFEDLARLVFARGPAALLLVDARHPGLESDRRAWHWITGAAAACAVVATKIDKLSRVERQRAIETNEAVFEHPVLPVSAETGEGLDQLWKLIERLLNSRNPLRPNSRPPKPPLDPPRRPPAPRHPRSSSYRRSKT